MTDYKLHITPEGTIKVQKIVNGVVTYQHPFESVKKALEAIETLYAIQD